MNILNREAAMKPRKTKHNLLKRKNREGYLFILPFLFGLFVIFLPALFYSAAYALSTVTVKLDDVQLSGVGFQNFIDAFRKDTGFRVLILSAVQGMAFDLITVVIFSFFAATLLNQKFLGRGVARTVFFLPVLLSSGIIASVDMKSVMMEAFSSSNNTASTISSAFTAGGFNVLFDLKEILSSVNLNQQITSFITSAVDNTYNIVNLSGVQILIFLSALQSINPSIFESARVEGATKWEEFWKITFPMITPMILVNVVYTVVDSFSNPKYGILDYIDSQAFSSNQIGFASALSWIYFLIVIVFLGAVCGILAKRITYLD
ncbi:MAG: sugar ABC transporter permease [Oscillospiraceae bacterium]|nr:sugar ABC transporter permease [Oscillospiraceae bacterium]